MNGPADQFDVEAGAAKVLRLATGPDARLRRIDIVTVQAVLKCQYRQAAEVVAWLVRNGKVRAG